jgi:hypothetical protein
MTELELLEGLSRVCERGCDVRVVAHDVLNPAFGYLATIEGFSGKVRGEGDTPTLALTAALTAWFG